MKQAHYWYIHKNKKKLLTDQTEGYMIGDNTIKIGPITLRCA